MTERESEEIARLRDEVGKLSDRVADIDKRLAVAETQRDAHRLETMAALERIEEGQAAKAWTPSSIAAVSGGIATVLGAFGTIVAGMTGHLPAQPAELPPPVEAPAPTDGAAVAP